MSVLNNTSIRLTPPKGLPEGLEEYCLNFSRLIALGVMSSAIMHEIGNALTVISGNAQIILYKKGDLKPDDILNRIQKVQDQVDRIQDTIQRVGSFSARAEGTMQNVSPESIIDNALYAFDKRCNLIGIAIERDIAPSSCDILCDSALLEFMILELLASFWGGKAPIGTLSARGENLETGWALTLAFRPHENVNAFQPSTQDFTLLITLLALDKMKGELNFIKGKDSVGWKLLIPWKKTE